MAERVDKYANGEVLGLRLKLFAGQAQEKEGVK